MPHRWEEVDPAGATWERQMCEEQEEELGYNPGVNVVHWQDGTGENLFTNQEYTFEVSPIEDPVELHLAKCAEPQEHDRRDEANRKRGLLEQ